MTTLTAKQIYDLSLQQIAAESFLDFAQDANYQGDKLDTALRLGSNNYAIQSNITDPAKAALPGKTRMTDAQIADFTATYDIIAHRRNTASGFSGTLLKNRSTGEYTLSFRSTEFADDNKGGDWSRDGVTGADGEMAAFGFAFAQIGDAEAWFRQLRTQGLLPSDKNYNVTGYSLGGHIATVFAEAHKDDPQFQRAYLFNAPGRGTLPVDVTVKQLVDDIYARMSQAGLLLQEGGRTYGYNGQTSQGDVYRMSAYINAGGVQDALHAIWQTSGLSNVNPTPGGTQAENKITQIAGKTDTGDITFTANGGVHTADIINVFIEDQPLIEGLAFGWIGKVIGLKNNDFGNTHAITLIADSARVGILLQKLDPNLSNANVKAILSASSNQRGISSPPSLGQAESNSLENALQPLLRLFGLDTQFDIDPQGSGFGNLANRNQFYGKIKQIESAFAALGSNTTFSLQPFNGISAAGVVGLASLNDDTGIAYRYALKNLNPYAIVADTNLYALPVVSQRFHERRL